MSTRAVIGVYEDRQAGKWRGTYHHFDGYPSGLGQTLWKLYHELYEGLLPAMLEMLIDAHPQGWSSIIDCDWTLKPTWLDNRGEWYNAGKKCPATSYKYRPGEDHEPWRFDQTSDGGQEWAYVFDLEDYTMTIFERVGSWEDVTYRRIETLPLAGSEPDWKSFE